ncbi:MAG: sortase [Actinomycetes bacterium]
MATTVTVEAPATEPDADSASSEPPARRRLRRHASKPTKRAERPSNPWSVGMVAGTVALTFGLALVGYVAFLAWGSSAQYSRTQSTLYDTFREELVGATAPVQAPSPPGDPVALVTIPGIGLDQVVVQGANGSSLTRGLGHRTDTVLPGQEGVSVIFGRRAAYGGAFSALDTIDIGDQIHATTGQGEFTYTVDNIRYSDEEVELPDAAASRLVLVTSDPAWRPGRSLLVSAAIDGKAQAAAVVGAALPSEQPLAIEKAAILPTLLWAQALFLVALGTAWAWLRYTHAVIWMAAAPLFLLVAWNLFENLTLLLPNTL